MVSSAAAGTLGANKKLEKKAAATEENLEATANKQKETRPCSLGSLVRRHLHTRLYVNPLIVFANEKAALNIK